MTPYCDIPVKTLRAPAAYCNYPKAYTVPKGWFYRTNGMYGYRRNWYCEKKIYLHKPGDWLEIVNPEHTQRIRYILY